jgi:hypothetical protein
MNEKLLAKIRASKEHGPMKAISESSAEDYAALENSVKVLSVVIPWKSGKPIYREERGVHKAFYATFVDFNVSVFKSRVKETLGDLAEGASIDIFGFDVEVDGQGNPVYTTEKAADGTEFQALKLITEDEQGTPLEPKFGMSFRPQMGVDRTKQWFARLRDQDMLNLVPNKGVPRKDATVIPAEGAETTTTTQRRENVAWDLLPNLQQYLEKPILNNRLELAEAGITPEEAIEMEGDNLPTAVLMAKFIASIPTAPNAPSKRAAQQTGMAGSLTGGSTQVATVVDSMEGDAFAKPPEETQ